ncbi:MAG: HPF/RaiA family ribosome-associated protein [Planctomycetes bacterium]|nr:HPF/RaiA family ribosome-associated protein [Planctomycetota bacterium]
MEVPLEVSFPDTDKPQNADELIREQVERLEEVHDNIISCHLTVEKVHEHKETGHPFRIRLMVRVPPGHEVIATNNPNKEDMHDPFHVALRKVFDRARRQIKKLAERQHGKTKTHPEQEQQGIVTKLFEDEDYGFLRAAETNEEIYFHRNSVLNDAFDALQEGTVVRYVAETGMKGPQASTVHIQEQPDAK